MMWPFKRKSNDSKARETWRAFLSVVDALPKDERDFVYSRLLAVEPVECCPECRRIRHKEDVGDMCGRCGKAWVS